MGLRASRTLGKRSDAGTLDLDASVVAVRNDRGTILIERANIGHGGDVVPSLGEGLIPANGMRFNASIGLRGCLYLHGRHGRSVLPVTEGVWKTDLKWAGKASIDRTGEYPVRGRDHVVRRVWCIDRSIVLVGLELTGLGRLRLEYLLVLGVGVADAKNATLCTNWLPRKVGDNFFADGGSFEAAFPISYVLRSVRPSQHTVQIRHRG